ncbi:MAG: PCYCGC domain-containing protein [Anaerolineales bacterium]
MTASFRRPILLLVTLTLILSGALSACSAQEAGHPYSMAPMDGMPAEVQSAPVTVQQAYQFAVANPDVLHELPCYCGCGPIGHTSNYACYVAEQNADGSVKTFDNHALGCSICVDITQDAIRLLREGKSVPEIRAYVDQTYAKYGPSNMP